MNLTIRYSLASIFAAALTFALMAMTAAAAGPYDAITTQDDNPAFQDSGRGSIENTHNPALRFGEGGRFALPGEGGQHANENAAVDPYSAGGSQSIVDPQGAF